MSCNSVWRALVLLLLAVSCAHGLVLGIDLGSQWYKMSMVKPGAGFDIVLNEQSSRKTHTMVSWNKDERVFGSDAFNLQGRYPASSYGFLTPLVGKPHNHPIFTEAKDWITFNIVEDPDRNSFLVQHDADTLFTPEELLAMILRHAKELASTAMGATIKDCVITVPPFLTQHERQAILDAAEISGLKVLSLINDVTAFALAYAKDRNFDNDTQNVIFYDIGATSTRALLATFQSVQDIKSKKNKTISQILVRSVAWDKTLGGRFLDRNLANHFKKAVKAKYPDFNVDDVKFTLRMLREASKIKEILSANQAAQASLVGLGDHEDIILPITRKEFESLNADTVKRALEPIRTVLAEANMTKEEIHFVELVGGSTRVPVIQAALKDFLGREELDRHVNGDEGAAIGAAFFAAGLSPTFRVKEIRLRDIAPYAVNVKINIDQSGDADEEIIIQEDTDEENVTNTALIHRGNKLNTRKTLTFYSYSNFSLDLAYADPASLPAGSQTEISHIAVTGMPSSHRYNLTAKPKVHASFKLTASGTVELDHTEVELSVLEPPKPKAPKKAAEKPAEQADKSEPASESASEKAEPAAEGAAEKTDAEADTTKEAHADSEHQQQQPEGEQPAAAEEETEDDTESDKTHERTDIPSPASDVGSDTESATAAGDGDGAAGAEGTPDETKEPELVKRTFKLPLKISLFENVGVKNLNSSTISKAETRLGHYDYQDRQRKDLQKEKNGLEAYIYETRDKLVTDEVIESSTEEEREALSGLLATASDWLDENSESAHIHEYRAQSRILKDKAEKIYTRIKERKTFPKAVAELQQVIRMNREILPNITEYLNVTEEERDSVVHQIDTIASWLQNKSLEQFAVPKNADPVVTTDEVNRKLNEVEMRMKILLRKPKKKKPVEVKVEKPEEDATEGNEEGQTGEQQQPQENAEQPPASDEQKPEEPKSDEHTAEHKADEPSEQKANEPEANPQETKSAEKATKGGKKSTDSKKPKDSSHKHSSNKKEKEKGNEKKPESKKSKIPPHDEL